MCATASQPLENGVQSRPLQVLMAKTIQSKHHLRWCFPKLGVPYWGVLIIREPYYLWVHFRGPLLTRTPPDFKMQHRAALGPRRLEACRQVFFKDLETKSVAQGRVPGLFRKKLGFSYGLRFSLVFPTTTPTASTTKMHYPT